jgi:hypothetical protein
VKQIGVAVMVMGIMGLVAPDVQANRCLSQDDSAGRSLRPGGSGGGAVSGARLWVARYGLQPAGSVVVENVQGDINVEGWDRAEVQVAVIKQAAGPEANPDDVHIDVESQDQRLVLRTVYPGQSAQSVRVDYRLRVPRQVRLERLRTVDGNIKVKQIEGSVDARTLNGNIEQFDVSGSVVARAINGNIAVSLRALPEPPAPVDLDTVNGQLLLSLPPQANADLQLSTVAGRVDSRYTFAVSDVPGDTSWRTHLGRGGTIVRLRTIRGDIRIVENEELL